VFGRPSTFDSSKNAASVSLKMIDSEESALLGSCKQAKMAEGYSGRDKQHTSIRMKWQAVVFRRATMCRDVSQISTIIKNQTTPNFHLRSVDISYAFPVPRLLSLKFSHSEHRRVLYLSVDTRNTNSFTCL